MLEKLAFALSYAVRNMIRDRGRVAFTLLCIAAGVATVVALRALGLMLTDALTSNAQAFLRGDVRVRGSNAGEITVSAFSDGDGSYHPFTAANMPSINEWAASRDIAITYTMNTELMQAAVVTEGQAGPPALAMGVFIDPQVYPFYDTILAQEPAEVPLSALFDGPDQIVLGRRLADQIGAEVGDLVRIGSAERLHTVTGIVPDSAESSFDNPQSLLFSFVYLDRAELAQFGLPDVADRAYLKLPPGTDEEQIVRQVRQWPLADDYPRRRGNWRVTTATEVLADNQVIADVISRFVLVLSLVGLVIGGVGIINTMMVAVNRRSLEIAILKTLGLQGRDVSLVFMVEAALSGLVGSALGIVLGIFLSYLARDMGQQAFAVPLPWRVYGDPMLIAVALGMTTTVFFSLLPTMMATRIRPSLVLREGNIPMVRAGCLGVLLSLALLVVGFGLLVDLILGTDRFHFLNLPPGLTPGIVGTLGVSLVLGLLLALMWVVVWLVSKLPSFRNPNLQIAFRGLTTHRGRTALSLLALVIGMTALSGTLIMTRSINMLLYTSISQPIGGNVVILPLPFVQSTVRSRLDAIPAVNGYREVRWPSRMRLEAIDGYRNYEAFFADPDEDPQASIRLARLEFVLGVNVYGSPARGELVEGRFLGPEDAGHDRIVIPSLPELEAAGVHVGSTFTFRMGSTSRTFEVVGIVAPDLTTSLIPVSLNDYALQIPLDRVPRQEALPFDLIIVDAKPEAVNEVMAAIGAVPGVFVFDVTIFDSMLSRLLNQMAALPLLVAGLSLFAAAALIATTVALATMERRRQIAILKAIGVSREQALGQLLIENGVVGIAGGALSLLPTLLILALVPSLTYGIIRLPLPLDLVLLMLALSVLVTLLATLVTAWSASGEKPLNALRYE